jgi:hypothetical protein
MWGELRYNVERCHIFLDSKVMNFTFVYFFLGKQIKYDLLIL